MKEAKTKIVEAPAKGETKTKDAPSNAFGMLVADAGNGDLALKASTEQVRILKYLAEHPGKGTLTVKVVFASSGNGQVAFDYSVVGKLPEEKSRITVRYLGENGELLSKDPAQRELPFAVREVEEDQDKTVIRSIN